MEVSDHSPMVVAISTNVPKAFIFRFENYWLMREDFNEVFLENWLPTSEGLDKAKSLTRKLKKLRGALKAWSSKFSNLKKTISNNSLALQFLDSLEEYRDLSIEEWNFKVVVRENLLALLEQQIIYWMQRGSIKWATMGDAGTKFFHANATIRHRGNLITNLKDDTGNVVTSHVDKDNLIWESFKQRIGNSDFKHMLFDLSSIIQQHNGLDSIEDPFSTEEFDKVVKQLPNNKSPGSDGFSNEFIKKCWSTIKSDFYDLCWDFQANNVCLSSIFLCYLDPKSSSSPPYL
jgi:hypothetical protein